jgi:hypothetical protein
MHFSLNCALLLFAELTSAAHLGKVSVRGTGSGCNFGFSCINRMQAPINLSPFIPLFPEQQRIIISTSWADLSEARVLASRLCINLARTRSSNIIGSANTKSHFNLLERVCVLLSDRLLNDQV